MQEFYGEATSEMTAETLRGFGSLLDCKVGQSVVQPMIRVVMSVMLKRWAVDIAERIAMLEAKMAECELLDEKAERKRAVNRAKKKKKKMNKKKEKEGAASAAADDE